MVGVSLLLLNFQVEFFHVCGALLMELIMQIFYKEDHSMAWGKPKQTEMTTEINSNLKYAI